MSITIRAITDREIERFRSTLLGVFGFDPSGDPEGAERLQKIVDLSRTYCAFDGDQLVASSGSFSFGLSVPGAIVPMGGLTMVTVRPTHRRRGILRQMMAAHLADVSARGEPLSGLWASEGGIYGRFGYGVAAESDELKFSLAGHEVGEHLPVDDLAQLEEADARRILPAVYARAMASRPGLFTRSPDWWHYRRFADRPDLRKGRSPRMHVMCSRAGEPTGYLVYRQQLAFDEGAAAGQLDIEEMVAVDARAEVSLFRYAASVDLFPKVSWWNAPTDALLPWLLRDRRGAVRKRRTDTLWLRLCDVERALSARRYTADGRLRLSIEGHTYELEVEGGQARCSVVQADPQLELSLGTLSSLYMGSVAPSLLARAGLIQGDAQAVHDAERIFPWPIAAWCPEVF